MDDYSSYFEFRRVKPDLYQAYRAPAYVLDVIGGRKDARILDFGCGFGQFPQSLTGMGYTGVEGLDIAPQAIDHCRRHGLTCHDGRDDTFFHRHRAAYDYVHLSHVVEHFPKAEIIPLLERVRGLLKPGGAAIIVVPNAQSHTGAYWAYEDFTHYTLFTSGSLYYVLRAAGFSTVEIVDQQCLAGLHGLKRTLKWALLRLYTLNYRFWNRVTSSVNHAPSPPVFGFEVKAVARF